MRFIIILFLLLSGSAFSQSEVLAKNYFDQGEYEKALSIYEALYKQNPNRREYFFHLVSTHQQLENFEIAQKLIETELAKFSNNATLYIELGKNYLLKKEEDKAQENFDTAIAALEKQPNAAYTVGVTFEKHNLLDYAIEAYTRGMELNPKSNYYNQLARIYGEQGKIEKMFESYLDILEKNAGYLSIVLRNFSLYITEDPSSEANDLLRKALLKKSQKNPDVMFNDMLSWLFVQQKEYNKALIQQKAIHRRTSDNLAGIMDLAKTATQNQAFESAKDALEFVIENSYDENNVIEAERLLLQIAIETSKKNQFSVIEKQYEELIKRFGREENTFSLQLDYNLFLAFQMQKRAVAVKNLKQMKEKNWSRYREATLLMTIADILILDEKFNEALIYYSQVQHKVKNDPLAQEARFKVARTSYFKGDFKWAETQLEVLKKSTSQLIANDAMELSLLIRDNITGDSIEAGLKAFAKADLLTLQMKNQEAISLYDNILETFAGETIIDNALLQQAILFEETGEYSKAENNYLKIISDHKHGLLIAKAYFRLAELYHNTLEEPEKAKEFYEYIIFNHPDSIYFVEARKKYRMIRGDVIN